MAGRSWEVPDRARPLDRVSAWLSNPTVVTWTGIGVLWALLLAGVLPIMQIQAAPSGADPGNWLDLAWSLTGQGARLSAWAYPPLALILLRGLLIFLKPLVAIKVFGLVCWGSLATAMWLVLNRSLPLLPWPIKLGMAALFSFPGYIAEMFAWGGYPQLLGMAFLVLALPAFEKTLQTGQRRMAVVAVAAGLGVIYTHHLLAALLPVFWIFVFLWTIVFVKGPRRPVWSRFWKVSAIITLLALPALPIYLKYFSLLAGAPTNSNGFSFQTIPYLIEYVYSGLAPLWLALSFLGILAPVVMPRTRLSASTMAFILVTFILFSFVWEVRLLPVLFAGMAFGLGILLEDAWSHPAHPQIARVRSWMLAACFGLALIAGLVQGYQHFSEATAYYRVLDNAMLPSMDWIISHIPPGDRIAASQTQPYMVGWWIEGYARRPTLAATDPRWLSFSGEKHYAEIANQIFSRDTPPGRITQLLYANDVRWLFIDKRSEDFDLSALIGNGLLTGAYEDRRVLILKVNRIGPAALAGQARN